MATGFPPGDLLDLPDVVLTALDEEAQHRWGVVEELLATLVEVTHSLLRVQFSANGGKKRVDPLKVPRPHAHGRSEQRRPAQKFSPSEFAALVGRVGKGGTGVDS